MSLHVYRVDLVRQQQMAQPSDLTKILTDIWAGKIEWDCPMAQFSSLRVGGPVQAAVFPSSSGELVRLIAALAQADLPWWVIGRGTNILVADEGLPGVAIILGQDFSAWELEAVEPGRVLIRAEAGCSLARLVRMSVEQELSGLEFAAGIPGSLGGAIVMNAGAWGQEIGSLIAAVSIIDPQGRLHTRSRTDLRFAYRTWSGGHSDIVVSATLELQRGKREEIEALCRQNQELRRERQPTGALSAGSFFKNTPAGAAGKLIDTAGLKGCRIGGAMVSAKHANFIVNVGNATAKDIIALMCLIQEKIRDMTGVELEPEVKLLGFRG